MKTKLFSVIMVLLVSTSLAIGQETANTKTSFALLGGINFQNFNGKDYNGDKIENDLILGYHVGVNIQVPIVPEFYFQPGILFSAKGSKNIDGQVTSTYKLSYIELPLNLVYKALVGNGYIMIGFGPYIGYGVGGKATFEGGPLTYTADIEYKSTVEISDPITVAYFKAFDAGATIFAGYEMSNGIFFQLNTQLGMLKINPDDNRLFDDKSSVKNTGFGLSLGYRF